VRVLHDAAAVAARTRELAADIAAARGPGADVVLVAVLMGGLPFTADLGRALHAEGLDCRLDAIRLSSYGYGRTGSTEVRLLADVATDLSGRHAILVDDVLDTGRSLAFARRHLAARGAASVCACVLADKRRPDALTHAEHSGFTCPPDAFLVGCGMDDAGLGRFSPEIAAAD